MRYNIVWDPEQIIKSDGLKRLEDFCNEVNGETIKCLGLGRDYCPRTCTYALKNENSIDKSK